MKLVSVQGLSQEAAANRLSIPKETLGNWGAASKAFSHPSALGARSAAELEIENARLRKELAEARLELDIIKRRQSTLPGRSCPVVLTPGNVVPFPFFTFDEESMKKVAIARFMGGK